MSTTERQIQLRRGTAADWTTVNPTLAAGELGVELDTGKRKLGNGVDDWQTLPYEIRIVVLTQAEFGQIDPPDDDTVYVIVPA